MNTVHLQVLMRSAFESADSLHPPQRGTARAVLELGCQYR